MMRGDNIETKKLVREYIPQNSIGAEIGVWKAKSSLNFLEKTKHLYLVDPWNFYVYDKEDTGWVNKQFNDMVEYNKPMTGADNIEQTQEFVEQVYLNVCNIMKDKPVTIYRETSDEWFSHFNETLDWIYIDGDHSYDGCYNDLNNALNITKDFIFCDDYNVAHHEGVRFAIDDFCAENNLSPIPLYTNQCMIKL